MGELRGRATVAVTRSGAAAVYDLDTALDFPCALDEYLWRTFRPNLRMDPHYASCFRVVPAALYLEYFASDRSHMVRAVAVRIPRRGARLTPPWGRLLDTCARAPHRSGRTAP